MRIMLRQHRVMCILACSLLLNLVMSLVILRWILLAFSGNEDLEQALVYLPIQPGSTHIPTIRLAVPKYLRHVEVKSFGQLSENCQLTNNVLDCPEVHLHGESMVRQSQLVLIRMLKVFDMIAIKHSIRYFLMFGTLLGAYRHGASLAHDHDIDIGILLDDYNKLKAIIRKDLPTEFFFQDGSDEPDYPKTRAVKAKLRAKQSCYANCLQCNFNDGLQIDIFVFKPYSNEQVADTERSKHVYPTNAIMPIGTILFEGLTFPAPANVPLVLELSYGKNFMIPDVSYPTEHHIPSPWYSCDYIRNSKNREKILKELYIR